MNFLLHLLNFLDFVAMGDYPLRLLNNKGALMFAEVTAHIDCGYLTITQKSNTF